MRLTMTFTAFSISMFFSILILGNTEAQEITNLSQESLSTTTLNPRLVPIRQYQHKLQNQQLTSPEVKILDSLIALASSNGDTSTVLDLKLRSAKVHNSISQSAEALGLATQV